MEQQLTGVVERVTFHGPDSGFAVLRVQIAGRRGPVTVVGTVPSINAGERIEATGQWIVDRQHGEQFKATTLRCLPPTTKEGIERYLASGLVKGIGAHYAKKIVARFGEKTLEVIDESPTYLAEIKGLGPKRISRIRESWLEQKAVRGIMVFLQSHGIGTSRAVRIYRTYGDRAIDLVRENPYRLATDIWGVGFKTADDLAGRLGIPADSPYRARAALRYLLQQQQTEGHVGYPEEGLLDATHELTGIDHETLRQAVEAERQSGEIVREPGGEQPWLYLKPVFLAEHHAARLLHRLTQGTHPLGGVNLEPILTAFEQRAGIELAPAQREAITAATREKTLIITGGPGVGKTTIVRGILDVFAARRQRIALAAPTGRAARRLSETTGREAKTIHRLLEFDPGFGGFRRDNAQPLECDLLVIDEASMIDMTLMYHLLKAVPAGACLILVGDVNQLPSVGPGTVLADVIGSGVVSVVRLTEIFRQAQSSWIVRGAHAILAGDVPESAPAGGDGDFYFVEASTPEAILDRVTALVRERIPKRFGLDAMNDVQVLAPMNRGTLGVEALNQHLQAVLNPPRAGAGQVERFGTTFRLGDKVIQTQNDYKKEVFNGDIGRVVALDEGERELVVSFDGREVVYDFAELDELMLAYGLSIHRSQGSEYPAVILPLATQHFVMLQRNLLYTGVTRGKKIVVVVGQRRALEMAVQRQEMTQRCCALGRRLREASQERQ